MWLYCESRDIIYTPLTGTLAKQYTTTHKQQQIGNMVYEYQNICSIDTNPLIPCTTTQQQIVYGYLIKGTYERGPIKPMVEDTFIDYLRRQCVGEKWVYQNFTISYDLSAILTSLKN